MVSIPAPCSNILCPSLAVVVDSRMHVACMAQTLNEGIDAWINSAEDVEPVASPRLADCNTPDQPRRNWRAALLYAYMPFDASSPAGDQKGRACKPTWWRWSTVLKFFTANSIIGGQLLGVYFFSLPVFSARSNSEKACDCAYRYVSAQGRATSVCGFTTTLSIRLRSIRLWSTSHTLRPKS